MNKIKHHGLNRQRLKDNPMEEQLADAWEQTHVTSPDHLGWILDVQQSGPYPPTPSERDRDVAASVIQWLGSPVGQGWLAAAIGSDVLSEMAKAQVVNEEIDASWNPGRGRS